MLNSTGRYKEIRRSAKCGGRRDPVKVYVSILLATPQAGQFVQSRYTLASVFLRVCFMFPSCSLRETPEERRIKQNANNTPTMPEPIAGLKNEKSQSEGFFLGPTRKSIFGSPSALPPCFLRPVSSLPIRSRDF